MTVRIKNARIYDAAMRSFREGGLVIEDGKVAEEGTHKELLAKEDGVYKKLYTLQLEALKNAGISE